MNTRTKVETFSFFSPNAQADYVTALPNAAFTVRHDHHAARFKRDFKFVTNKEQVGRGHENTTRKVPTTADARVSYTFDLSSWAAVFWPAFGMGKLTAIQPDESGSPLVWEITVEPMNIYDAAVGKQLPATSIVEVKGTAQTLYRGCVVADFEMSGEKAETQIKLACNVIGSGYHETPSPVIALPDFVQTEFLTSGRVTFNLGGTDIAARICNWKYGYKNKLDESFYPGGPLLSKQDGGKTQSFGTRDKCLVSEREQTLDFAFLQEDADVVEDDLFHAKVKSVTITADGAPIDATYNHQMQIVVPNLTFAKVEEGESEGADTWQISTEHGWDETNWRPCYIKITTTVDASTILTPPA